MVKALIVIIAVVNSSKNVSIANTSSAKFSDIIANTFQRKETPAYSTYIPVYSTYIPVYSTYIPVYSTYIPVYSTYIPVYSTYI